MHSYSIDIDIYNEVMWFLTMGSALLIVIINYIIPLLGINMVDLNLQIIWLFISSFFSFGFIFSLFDNYLWKVSFINNCIKYPNISGKWEGTIDNYNYGPIPTKVIIKQTFTKININLRTENANSNTKALAFSIMDYDNPRLNYIYYNISETNNLKHHGGTGSLEFLKNENILKGEYYTDKHRTNHGTIYLKRIG